jgi:hypothetical protein
VAPGWVWSFVSSGPPWLIRLRRPSCPPAARRINGLDTALSNHRSGWTQTFSMIRMGCGAWIAARPESSEGVGDRARSSGAGCTCRHSAPSPALPHRWRGWPPPRSAVGTGALPLPGGEDGASAAPAPQTNCALTDGEG